jgi:hypothetical protein
MQQKEGKGETIMLSLLSSTAMTMIVNGVLVGTILGLIYRMHVVAVRTAKLNTDVVDTALLVRQRLSSIEYRVTHIQAALKARTNGDRVLLEYL